MKNDIEILLSEITLLEEKTEAAKRIINTYNLPLTEKNILSKFKGLRCNIRGCIDYDSNFQMLAMANHHQIFNIVYQRNLFLCSDLLDNNKQMFVAMIKNIYTIKPDTLLVSEHEPYTIGYVSINEEIDIVNFYKKMLDHNDFDLDNLVLPHSCKIKIQKYRDIKNNGKLTKAAC